MEYDSQRKNRPKPLAIIFVVVQIIIIILIALSASKLFQTDEVANTPSDGPSAKIVNATEAIPEDYSGWTEIIEWALFNTILENIDSSSLAKNQVDAYLREGSIKTQSFDRSGANYVRAIVDLPELEQSYEIFLEYPNSKNAISAVEYSESNVAKPYSILCLANDSDKIYSDFNCKETAGYSSRQKIVSNMLDYFYFDYFSAYLNPSGPGTVIISPSVTYDNDDATKAEYIAEVKASIDSLGIPSDSFSYYVRTAADVNYRN